VAMAGYERKRKERGWKPKGKMRKLGYKIKRQKERAADILRTTEAVTTELECFKDRIVELSEGKVHAIRLPFRYPSRTGRGELSTQA